MIVISIVDESTIPHGKNTQDAGIFRLSSPKHGALNALITILHQVGCSYENGAGLECSGQLNGKTLLADGNGIVVVQIFAFADSLGKTSKGEGRNSRHKEHLRPQLINAIGNDIVQSLND